MWQSPQVPIGRWPMLVRHNKVQCITGKVQQPLVEADFMDTHKSKQKNVKLWAMGMTPDVIKSQNHITIIYLHFCLQISED